MPDYEFILYLIERRKIQQERPRQRRHRIQHAIRVMLSGMKFRAMRRTHERTESNWFSKVNVVATP